MRGKGGCWGVEGWRGGSGARGRARHGGRRRVWGGAGLGGGWRPTITQLASAESAPPVAAAPAPARGPEHLQQAPLPRPRPARRPPPDGVGMVGGRRGGAGRRAEGGGRQGQGCPAAAVGRRAAGGQVRPGWERRRAGGQQSMPRWRWWGGRQAGGGSPGPIGGALQASSPPLPLLVLPPFPSPVSPGLPTARTPRPSCASASARRPACCGAWGACPRSAPDRVVGGWGGVAAAHGLAERRCRSCTPLPPNVTARCPPFPGPHALDLRHRVRRVGCAAGAGVWRRGAVGKRHAARGCPARCDTGDTPPSPTPKTCSRRLVRRGVPAGGVR